jgi:hypothetical protein
MDTTTPTEHQQQEDERLAGDVLVGADAILNYLIFLGVLPPEASVDEVYYLKRTGRWPIGNTAGDDGGGKLLAIKRRIARHVQKIAAG